MTGGWTVAVEADPDPDDAAQLVDRVRAEAVAAAGVGVEAELVVVARCDGRLVGGCCGLTWGGTCQLDTLWVDPALRGRGLGRELLERAESEAAARGCAQVVLLTYDFQAPDLYRRCGYRVVGQVDDYPQGHRALWLRKALTPKVD